MSPMQANEFEFDLGVVEEVMSNAATTAYTSQKTSHGRSGVPSALVTVSFHSSEISRIPFPTCKSLPPDT